MADITRVLCPIDFSEASKHAVKHAEAIAEWYGAPVAVLHLLTPVPEMVPALELATVGAAEYAEPHVHAVADAARDFVTSIGVPRYGLEVAVEVGWPAAAIVKAAAAVPGTLIVMGTHGASGIERLVLGSVTEKVVRNATVPVMTVPPHAYATSSLPFKRILCAVDFSPASKQAVSLAMSLAKEGDAALTLLHVVQGVSIEEAPPHSRAFHSPEFAAFRERDAVDSLRKLLPTGADDWCSPHVLALHGKPGPEILKYAADQRVDLIVMGVHGRSAIDRFIFGSTATQVVREATCPVITERA
jgi:nucleotide-binding universal stress UspA family protein